MAEIVLGLGTSHSPMLSLPGDMWGDYAARDKSNPMLLSALSALAKGYAVDILYDYLIQLGFNDFMIEIGGEVRCCGDN